MALFFEDVCYNCGVTKFKVNNIQINSYSKDVRLEIECDKCSHQKAIITTLRWWLEFVAQRGELKKLGNDDANTY